MMGRILFRGLSKALVLLDGLLEVVPFVKGDARLESHL